MAGRLMCLDYCDILAGDRGSANSNLLCVMIKYQVALVFVLTSVGRKGRRSGLKKT